MHIQQVLSIPPGPGNPRNSEGDFIQLSDGSILFVYTHFTGGAADEAAAYLAGRLSHDRGVSWSKEDRTVLVNEGQRNIMSVSLLRLDDGRIALFYLRKNGPNDCRPYLRFSRDEAMTWGEPVECIPESQMGYYVLNNDRVIRLASGRLLMPLAHHPSLDSRDFRYGTAVCYYSDDNGDTWNRGIDLPAVYRNDGAPVVIQEPGVVELADSSVLMFCRTDAGSQYMALSYDGGVSWSELRPSELLSPLSPASIKRIPRSDDLLAVWNNHQSISPDLVGKRTPLSIARSNVLASAKWEHVADIEDNPHGCFCYTAIEFVDDHILLAYCAGDLRETNGLAVTQITRLPLLELLA